MCNPLIAVAAVTALATVAGGVQQKQAAEAAADIEKMNADIARRTAASEAARARAEVDRALGAQRAAIGASGLDMSGTALDLGEDSSRAGALDVATLIYGGTVRAHSYQTAASQLQFQGRQAFQASLMQAGTSFLGSVFTPAKSATPGTALTPGPRTAAWHQTAGI